MAKITVGLAIGKGVMPKSSTFYTLLKMPEKAVFPII
jgi:hypothetical protein